MLKQIEGSRAMAEAIALCRPEVVCAYPITPQTHIVEGLGEMVKGGRLENCEFINVESDFSALSVAIGASAAGARAYTATASQGLLLMAEAVYNASGLGLPIVMTLVNRAIGAPANMWNDHSDAMSMRDAGWVQLFAETNQEAADLHIQAFRLAEELSIPVMVCVDGFILTHAVERVDIPNQAMVDAYLPPYDPVQVLDPAEPVTMGAMVGPDAFTEVRFLAHYKQTKALRFITQFADAFAKVFGRKSGGLLRGYRTEGRRDGRGRDGLGLRHYQGYDRRNARRRHSDRSCHDCLLPAIPDRRLAEHPRCGSRRRRDRKEPCLSAWAARSQTTSMRRSETCRARPRLHSAVAGLGGRPITRQSLHRLFRQAATEPWEGTHFLDMNDRVVGREIHRAGKLRRSGPTAEAILRYLAESAPDRAAE